MPNSALPVEQIPQCLRDRPQWVCWKYVERDGRQTKVPVNARTGRNASATDPQTWTTFQVAHDAYQRSDQLAGVGFVFAKDDPFAGMDLDNCLDEQGGFTWGQDIVERLATYTEVSPSGRGVKLVLQGAKPAFAKCRKDGLGPAGQGHVEVYDQGRFFAVTGRPLAHTTLEVAPRQSELDSLCNAFWGQSCEPTGIRAVGTDACLESMLAMRLADHNDGSYRLFSACCRCVEHGLSDAEALACIRQYERERPFPADWSDQDILKRLRDAEKQCQRGAALPAVTERVRPAFKSLGELLAEYPDLRPPVIHGLLREGESMNVIAASKVGKSWLITDLAATLATGRRWLDTFDTEPGNVLVLDNELHQQTSANRFRKVLAARRIRHEQIANRVFVENLRGRLRDIYSLAPYFEQMQPGFFKVLILDATYRFFPRGTDENSNAALADIYNQLDAYAGLLGCSFVLVHHASKGNQSGKAVTDVGAGAGSQSRAADTHLVLRPHEETDCVVVDAAVRSWPPIEPRCIRWTFPLWTPDDSLDPAALRPERPKRRSKPAEPAKPVAPPEPEWTPERFADRFGNRKPDPTQALIDAAGAAGLSQRRARTLLREAVASGLLFRWSFGANKPVEYATVPQANEDPR